MKQFQHIGVSFEREADSPNCWKHWKPKQRMELWEASLVLCKQGVTGSIPVTSTIFPYFMLFFHKARGNRQVGFTIILRSANRQKQRPESRILRFETRAS
jgi:hypothetical protein